MVRRAYGPGRRGCSLGQHLTRGSGTAFYEYDFGDSWLHRTELVARRPAGEDTPSARLTDGALRGPLEDSQDTSTFWTPWPMIPPPDHAEYSEWVTAMTGTDTAFDPGFFDIARVNRTLVDEVS